MDKSTSSRLRFIVRFAAEDLRNFREGDWLNLREDLDKFLFGSLVDGSYPDTGMVGIPRSAADLASPNLEPGTGPIESAAGLTNSDIWTIQTDLHTLLRSWAKPRREPTPR